MRKIVKEVRQWNDEVAGGKLSNRVQAMLLADLLEELSSKIYCTRMEFLRLEKKISNQIDSNKTYILEKGQLVEVLPLNKSKRIYCISKFEGHVTTAENTIYTSKAVYSIR